MLISAWSEDAWERMAVSAVERRRLDLLETRALIVVPLRFRDEVLGAMALGMDESGRTFDTMDLLLAKDLAHRVAMALGGIRLYVRAQNAIQARDEVLKMVSHDLRNPLSTIGIGVGLLHEVATERRDENRKWLQLISRSVSQMNSMIEDLLDLSRIDGGRFVVTAGEQDVGELLLEACEALQPLAAEKGLSLEYEAGEGVGSVWADRQQIQRVFSNLVGNALKFTPEAGHVKITTSRVGSDVLFAVRDSGPGIDADQLPHVFDRYWQARQADRRGVGLGLPIARGIVESHGGKIWAESIPGEGATFYFTIPTEAPISRES